MCVLPGNEGVFRRPNPDPLFLKFYLLCKEEFQVHPTIQDEKVRVFSLNARVAKFQRALDNVDFSIRPSFIREYQELTFPLEQLSNAFESISQVISCGK